MRSIGDGHQSRRWGLGIAAVVMATSLSTAPAAIALPGLPQAGWQPADATIDAYATSGFDVHVQFTTGTPDVPLSECKVTEISNPGSDMAVDIYVACPDRAR